MSRGSLLACFPSWESALHFEKRDGGVYVEVEAIALSRDVPLAMRELVNPIIRRVSKSTVVTALDETRKAVEKSATAERTTYKVAQR